MSIPSSEQSRISNHLLRALPEEDFQRLAPHLQPVSIELSQVICEAGEALSQAYFITEGMVSLISSTTAGETVEVGMIGNEGMLGVPMLFKCDHLPYQIMVQMSGSALTVPMEVMEREFARGGSLHDLLLRFACTLIMQLTQLGLCNHFHTIEERLCRWLLVLHDYARADTVQMTQELLASMLGVRRTGVSMVAGTLQAAGLISYRRGRITILNRDALAASACECYAIIRAEYEPLLMF
jgi:CRP-like cAMP-binding protein